jgi:hypothetical protein
MEDTSNHEWVLAAPFRAHLVRVQAETGLPLPALAVQAGLPPALVDHLVHGRRGRWMHRIPPAAARRLLTLEPVALAELALVEVPAAPIAARIRELLGAGLAEAVLARWCRLTPSGLAGLATRRECSELTALLVRAAYQSLPAPARVGMALRDNPPLAA